jgi:hypothetical protein
MRRTSDCVLAHGDTVVPEVNYFPSTLPGLYVLYSVRSLEMVGLLALPRSSDTGTHGTLGFCPWYNCSWHILIRIAYV